MLQKQPRRGMALVVVLSVMAVLVTLGTSMVLLQTAERRASRNYLDTVRARLMAKAGVDFAVTRLREEAESGLFVRAGKVQPSRYWGDVNDEVSGAAPNDGCPIEKATNPSFAIEATGGDPYSANNPAPLLMKVDGRDVGVSMIAGFSTYGRNSDVAALRIGDLQGRLHLNDGLKEVAPHRPVSENLRRLLNILGSLPSVGESGLGDLLIGKRPAAGYRSRRELLTVLGNDPKRLAKIGRFVTTHAWVDKDVALPVPLSADALAEYPLGAHYYRGDPVQYRQGRGVDYKGQQVNVPLTFCPLTPEDDPAVRVWGLDELRPGWIQLGERAPVNVNTAPREVLLALVADLKGFFLMERRRKFGDEGAYPYFTYGGLGLYHWMLTYYTYSPEKYRYRTWWTIWNQDNYEVDEPDDVGRIYQTLSLPVTSGSTVALPAGTPTAEAVVDEMIACRERKASAGFDYSTAWFGGPFTTWRQFHAFCDNLAAIGVLQDTRQVFRDFPTTGNDPWGWAAATVVSPLQQKWAAQAMADVLKANFNPNLHLNELNPDRNLHLLVDKTDLMVQSTEFCFTPMGYFEIESLGRVLRPEEAGDALTAKSVTVSDRKCMAVVKIYDVHRQTHQKDFYAGRFAPRQGSVATNNECGVECGPEPDNGPGPAECEWDGWIQLATVGGRGAPHGKGTLEPTPPGDAAAGHQAKMYGHFGLDDRLDYHVDGPDFRENLARVQLPDEHVENEPDPGAPYGGPYVPTLGPPGTHRLARGFRVDPSDPTPSLVPSAGLDLRLDGLYSERHSGLGYWLSEQVLPKDANTAGNAACQNGVVAYWLKPSFAPELSAKSRQYLDLTHSASKISWGECPHEFTHYYYAGHDAPPYVPPVNEPSAPFYINAVGPMTFLFGMNWGGICTSTLNHESHPHAPKKRSVLRDHQWTHVVLRFKKSSLGGEYGSGGFPGFVSDTAIYVNGKLEADPADFAMGHAGYSDVVPAHSVKWWYYHADGSRNSVRLGAPSRIMKDYTVVWNRPFPYGPGDAGTTQAVNPNANRIQNWSADSTIDEFYFWGVPSNSDAAAGLGSALDLWTQGRYYAAPPSEAEFTSKPLTLFAGVRSAPPCSEANPGTPGSTTTATPPSPSPTAPAPEPTATIFGVAWTMYGEDVDGTTGKPFLTDHKTGEPVPAGSEISFTVGGVPKGLVASADGFSSTSGAGQDALVVRPSEDVRFVARLQVQGASLDTILLATPVIDDITVYVAGGIEYLDYHVE